MEVLPLRTVFDPDDPDFQWLMSIFFISYVIIAIATLIFIANFLFSYNSYQPGTIDYLLTRTASFILGYIILGATLITLAYTLKPKKFADPIDFLWPRFFEVFFLVTFLCWVLANILGLGWQFLIWIKVNIKQIFIWVSYVVLIILGIYLMTRPIIDLLN